MNKKLKVKCLVLDHDDTVVRSTPQIHFPSFKKSLSVLRPGMELSYEQFIAWNFEPGFSAMCHDILGFNEEEMAYQEKGWREGAESTCADMYEGFPELIKEYMQQGGIVCISSHSAKEHIIKDYKAAGVPTPHHIYDWTCERKKPDPFALEEMMQMYGLSPEELLMVDDLKPGYDMAKAVNVPFVCAGWSDNQIPKIAAYMKQNSDYYLHKVEDLKELLYI